MAEAFFALTHGGSLRAAQTARAVKSGLFTVDELSPGSRSMPVRKQELHTILLEVMQRTYQYDDFAPVTLSDAVMSGTYVEGHHGQRREVERDIVA
jgi:hypothetical protein